MKSFEDVFNRYCAEVESKDKELQPINLGRYAKSLQRLYQPSGLMAIC